MVTLLQKLPSEIFTIFFAMAGISVAFYTISLIMRYIYKFDIKRKSEGTGGIIKIPKKGIKKE